MNKLSVEEIIERLNNKIFDLEEKLDKKDKIIDNAINEVEKLREYFSEDLQPELIGILEILKDKPVIKW